MCDPAKVLTGPGDLINKPAVPGFSYCGEKRVPYSTLSGTSFETSKVLSLLVPQRTGAVPLGTFEREMRPRLKLCRTFTFDG